MFLKIIYIILHLAGAYGGAGTNINNGTEGPAQSCLKFSNSTAFSCEVNIREYLHYGSTVNVTCLEENVILIKQNRTRYTAPQYPFTYDYHHYSSDPLSAHYENDEMPPLATFTCTSLVPTDFYFEGVEAPEFFSVYRYHYDYSLNAQYSLYTQVLLTPETTGRFIFKSTANQAIQTSIFIFSERIDKPLLLGSDSVIPVIERNDTSVVLPCVSTDVSVNVTLFKLFNQTKWVKINPTTPIVRYDRQVGFILNKSIASPGDYRCYSNSTDIAGDDPDDFVTLRVPLPTSGTNHSDQLGIETYSGRASCYSKNNSSILHFSNTYTSNPSESRLLVQCFDKKNIFCASRFYRQSTEGRKIKRSCPHNTTNCLWVSSLYGGVLHCAVLGPDGRHGESITKQYFTGTDGNIYDASNISFVNKNALIRPQWWPTDNATAMRTNTHYSIYCNTAQSIFSDYSYTLSFKMKNGSVLPQEGQYGYHFVGTETEEIICSSLLWSDNQKISAGIRVNVTQLNCSQYEFTCGNGQCLSISYLCDGYNNCGDGSDESNCSAHRCASGLFQCTEGHCISDWKKCNNIADCADESDESLITCYDSYCSRDQLKCMNGQCLTETSLCDGRVDCYDKSDENSTECAKHYPKFEKTEQERTFIANTMNELVCKIQPVLYKGLKPKLTWARKGENVSERVWVDTSGSKVLLRFPNVSRDDAGEFSCIAINRLQRVGLTFKVKVKDPEPVIDNTCVSDLSKYQCRKRRCYYYNNMCSDVPEPTTTTTPSTTTTKPTTPNTTASTTTYSILGSTGAQNGTNGSPVGLTIAMTLFVVAGIAGFVYTIFRFTNLRRRFGIWRGFSDRERVLSGFQLQCRDNE